VGDHRHRWMFGLILAFALLGATPLPAVAACSTKGALTRELSKPATTNPGGVDFSTLELRYVSDASSGPNTGVQYAFSARPTTGPENPAAGQQAMQESLDSLFVWLALPASKFTVNLNPSEPNRIVDSDLGRTDAGRILLEADFAMKKTVARLIHPDTPQGAQFWAALQPGPDGSTCLSMRQWIVPAPATVREDGKNLYILDAPLAVKMETDYLAGAGVADTSCSNQPQSISAHNEQVFRTMILPQVEQAVNQAPEYASLRRVYLSRVVSEWYRKRAAVDRTNVLVDSGDVSSVESTEPWSPTDIFNQYVQSYKNGEFNVTHTTQQGNVITTHTYVFGGVDFTRVPERLVSAAEFKSKWAGLPERTARAIDQPTAEPGGGRVWLGGTAVVNAPSQGPLDRLLLGLASLFRQVLPVFAGAMVLLAIVVGLLVSGRWRPGRRTGMLALLAALALVAGGQAHPATPAGLQPSAVATVYADQGTGQVGYGNTPLSQGVQQQRLDDENWGNTYAAARLSDGSIIVGRSSAAGHAEQDVIAKANGRSITDLYVEFDPCATGKNCANAIARLPGNVRVTYSWRWNGSTQAETASIRAASRVARAAAMAELKKSGSPGPITSTEECG
jgi:Xanthomonas XOO_2897-like deaminase